MYILNDVNRNGRKIIAINMRWLHIVITKGDMSPPIRHKNRAPHILIIVVVVSLFLSSLSSRHPCRRILVLLVLSRGVSSLSYCCRIVSSSLSYRHRAPRGPSSEVGGIVHLEASCTSTLTSVCIWDVSYRSRPFANGNRRGIFPVLKTIYKREIYANGGGG
jgi:hypothetical protein